MTAVFGSLDLGSAVGLVLCGPMIRIWGWPVVFYSFAIMGGAWALTWPLLQPGRRDKMLPEDDGKIVEVGLDRAAVQGN